jgi:mevalonate kinase
MASTVLASAPGNLFFMGEHAVVYGYPSINAAIGKRCVVYAHKLHKKHVHLHSDAFGSASARLSKEGLSCTTYDAFQLLPLIRLAEMLIKEYELREGFSLRIRSNVPVESGMSSSTAVLCAVLHALNKLFSLNIAKEEYFDILLPLQEHIHGGKASGSELVSSTLGGFNKIQRMGKKVKRPIYWEHIPAPVILGIVGYTGIRAPTSMTVAMHVPSMIKRNKHFVFECFERIAMLSEQAVKALKSNDVHKLGELMNENHRLLQQLKLSHPKLDDLVEEALKAGALGAKMSGGGWGGAMFAIAEKQHVKHVMRAMLRTGSKVFAVRIGVTGVR